MGVMKWQVPVEDFLSERMKTAVFRDVASCRYYIIRRFGGTYRLHLQVRRKNKNPRGRNQREHVAAAIFSFFSSTLKMEAIRSSEMSVNTISTLRHIPEDDILHNHRRENLKSYK
jgi:hypothetical protein